MSLSLPWAGAYALANVPALPSGQLVQTPFILKEERTRLSPHYLSDQVMIDLRHVLKRRGLNTTTSQLDALQDVVTTLCAMAEGCCQPCLHLSSLDPGMGKTTALIQFLKRFVVSEEHKGVGVVVCLSRLDEVRRLVEETALAVESFAVLCRDEEVSALSDTKPDQAQVLFTTQQMLVHRTSGKAFCDTSDFFYCGRPRRVRVWDETIEPADVITLSSYELAGMLDNIHRIDPALAREVQSLQMTLSSAAKGDVVQLPAFDSLKAIRGSSVKEDQVFQQRLERLQALAGKQVRIVKSLGDQAIALDTRDALPADLAPLLVLDASGRVRQTYQAWERKGGLLRLRPATKSYGPLTVNLMNRGGGKDSWKKGGGDLAREVATAIDSKPDEDWLVVHHKATPDVDPKALILSYVKTGKSRINFIHWGEHKATNAFKNVPNVILAGLLHLPEVHLSGLAYASAGLPVRDDLPSDLLAQVERGELGHDIVQAIGRGTVRRFDNGRCGPCNAYIIAATKYQLAKELPGWFPDCRVIPWVPKHKPLKGRIAQAVVYLKQCCKERPGDPIWFREVMDYIGETNRSNFNRTIRKRSEFHQALKDLGLYEVQIESSRSNDAFKRPFGPVTGATYVITD